MKELNDLVKTLHQLNITQFLNLIMSNVFLVTALVIVSLQLVKVTKANQKKYQQLTLTQQQLQYCFSEIATIAAIQKYHQMTHQGCAALGQSIAALHIQLQVAQKLWQINPTQAQQALQEAHELSASLMQDTRNIVKSLKQTLPPNPPQNVEHDAPQFSFSKDSSVARG